MRQLTQEAKKAIVEKALNRKDQNLADVANIHNVGLSTLSKWIRKYKDSDLTACNQSTIPSGQFTRAEQFEHVIAASSLDEVDTGVYCRERGLYSFQLQQWKNEFMSQNNPKKPDNNQAELKTLRAEIKLLKKDLLRKDRALAETTALLVLKKKADLLFGGHADEE
jgi:transposase-like protein